MRRRLLAALLAAGVALGGTGLAMQDEIARVRAVLSLFDADRIVWNFSHMAEMFPSVTLRAPLHEPSPLPRSAVPAAMPAGFAAWVAERQVTSVLVLHDGEVAFEEYYLGTGPEDLRIGWSLSKSFLGTLTGLSVANGEIASLDDPVTGYVPELIGTAYDGATIRNVLNLATGVEFDEDYDRFWSDINRMGRLLALGGSLDRFVAGFDSRWADPGFAYHYVSIDTHVLGMVLRGATDRTVPELMNERLFIPLKLDTDPVYLTDTAGHAFVLGGLNLTTRDYARFAQMVLDDGRAGGTQIVPAAWVAEMGTISAPYGPGWKKGGGYGYQWRIPPDPRPGEVFARGVFGQYLWIDRGAGVAIVITAADRSYGRGETKDTSIEMLRAIVEAVS